MKAFALILALCNMAHALAEPAPAEALPAPAADIMSMNQDTRCGQVLVTSLINGVPMRMMLDTGATHTVLHVESASRVPDAQWLDTSKMQFRGNSAQHPKLFLASLQCGPAQSPAHAFMVMDLSAVRSMMAEKIDGILGMDILRHLPFTFNLRTGEFYWGIPADAELVPLHAEPDHTGRIIVLGKSGDKTARMLLDTGSSVTRIATGQWAPGAGAEIQAQIGDIDQCSGITAHEGAPGNLELAPGVIISGFTPLLCGADEGPMLGMDALKGQILVHIPTEDSPTGLFLLAK